MCKCDIRDGGLDDVLPPPTGEVVRRSLTAPPKKIQELGFFLNQMKLMSKQFNTEFRKKSKILSASSMQYRVQKNRYFL